MRHIAISCAVLALAGGWVRADEPESGPGVGKQAAGFEVELATGDMAGRKLDYLSTLKDKPVLIVFIGEMTRPGFGLLKVVDQYARLRQPDGLEVLIVRVSDDPRDAIRHSKLLYDNYDIKSPAAVTEEGKSGPKEYGLHEDAQMTVLLLDKEHKVAMNVARRAPERRDFRAIREGIDKLLGPSPVPFP